MVDGGGRIGTEEGFHLSTSLIIIIIWHIPLSLSLSLPPSSSLCFSSLSLPLSPPLSPLSPPLYFNVIYTNDGSLQSSCLPTGRVHPDSQSPSKALEDISPASCHSRPDVAHRRHRGTCAYIRDKESNCHFSTSLWRHRVMASPRMMASSWVAAAKFTGSFESSIIRRHRRLLPLPVWRCVEGSWGSGMSTCHRGTDSRSRSLSAITRTRTSLSFLPMKVGLLSCINEHITFRHFRPKASTNRTWNCVVLASGSAQRRSPARVKMSILLLGGFVKLHQEQLSTKNNKTAYTVYLPLQEGKVMNPYPS